MPRIEKPHVRWRKADSESYVWRDLGDGIVLFHRPSGKTHLMNDASFRLLTELLQEPHDLEAIAKQFEHAERGQEQEEYLGWLAEMLMRLEQYGLVERV